MEQEEEQAHDWDDGERANPLEAEALGEENNTGAAENGRDEGEGECLRGRDHALVDHVLRAEQQNEGEDAAHDAVGYELPTW